MHNEVSLKLKRRILLVLTCFIVGILLMCVRLCYVQFVEGEKLQLLADEQQTRDRPIPATRGNIYDRNLNVLAQSASVATIGVVHAQITDPERVAQVLSEYLEMDYDVVYKKVTTAIMLTSEGILRRKGAAMKNILFF